MRRAVAAILSHAAAAASPRRPSSRASFAAVNPATSSSSSTSGAATLSHPHLYHHQQQKTSSWGTGSWKFARHHSGLDGDPPAGEGDKAAAEKPARRKKLSNKERFGKYDEEFEDEMAQFPIDDTIEHLYDARPIFEEWMGHPTFYDMISADAYPKKGAPKDEPPGEGPILRWQTRVVLSPGGEAFHPKNRKVKVSVYVKELGLSPVQKERLLFMVGKRYNPNKDELTIVSERFDQREENRKDVLRILLSLIEEAKKEDEALENAQPA